MSSLSARWLVFWKKYVATDSSEVGSLGGELGHIRTRLTSASGTAVATFYVGENVALTMLLQSGVSVAAEQDVARLFVDSLKQSAPIRVEAMSSGAFEEILTDSNRPLMAVIPFPDPLITDEDQALVRELGLHLAGAFFGHWLNQ